MPYKQNGYYPLFLLPNQWFYEVWLLWMFCVHLNSIAFMKCNYMTCTFYGCSILTLSFQTNPLKSSAFQQVLTIPVAQKDSHLTKPWFHKTLSLMDAEDMLKRVRMDGAFLVRPSEKKSSDSQQNYSISYR